MSLASRQELTNLISRLEDELQDALDALHDKILCNQVVGDLVVIQHYEQEVAQLKRDFFIRRARFVLPVLREEVKEYQDQLAQMVEESHNAVDRLASGSPICISADRKQERAAILDNIQLREAAIRRLEEGLVGVDL